MITDTAGNVVWDWQNTDPYGNNMPNENPSGLGTFTCNLRHPGQYFDIETGLFQNHFRDYNPAIGAYIQSDLIGLAGGINTYLYALGNPLSFIDILGLEVDLKKMVDTITSSAYSRSHGQCAKHYRLGFEAGGGNSGYPVSNPVDAKDWGVTLESNGFNVVSQENYSPILGDTVVFGAVPGHSHGHIATYNGKQWVSDYKQNNFIPPSYVGGDYVIYRQPPSTDTSSSADCGCGK